MSKIPVTPSGSTPSDRAIEQQLREMNEALLLSLVRQHELIEQLQKADVLVRESEQRQRFVMDSMPQKIFTAEPNGDVDYMNPQWMEFTGLSFEQIRGWGWKQFVHPDDLDENIRLWQHSIDTGEQFQFEHRFRRADGEFRWHFSRAMAMRNEAGRVTKWVGSNTDVHYIKQAEVALQSSELRYRRLFEAASEGVLILDFSSGRIVDANPFMSKLLGYSRDDFRGQELWEIGLFTDRSASEAAVRELQEKGNVRFEHLPLRSDLGRLIEVEIVADVHLENDHPVIQCNIRDITERRRLESQLRGQAIELSDLHRRKDEFLAMLSHELRSPLAPIANAVQMLSLQQESETRLQQQARSIIERQLQQLQHLVDDLLEVSRITSGRVQLRPERITVNSIVTSAVETVRPLISQRGHELALSLKPEPIWLFVDAARIEQVIVNLLTNAAKYTEKGGHIRVTVELASRECTPSEKINEPGENPLIRPVGCLLPLPGGEGTSQSGGERGNEYVTALPGGLTPSARQDEVLISVRDNGVGIDPELQPHIFDLFTQAERSLDRSQGGLGIGLALVRRLTELHGGSVEVHSVPGEGSEFIVRLPLKSSVRKSVSDDCSSVNTHQSTNAAPLRVLVVDDHVDTVMSFSMLLNAQGHDVRTAGDGLAAVQAAIEFRPDLVLLDIGLPGLNGYEAARRIRQQPGLQDVVLVALTGYGLDADRANSLHAGFNHHLVKPARMEQLQHILTTVSEQK